MFGYIIVNKPEMKFKDFDLYHSFYCGLCEDLKHRYGRTGQLTLSYDMAFLALLLTALYEPDTKEEIRTCTAHPVHKHLSRRNVCTEYAADMNMILSYYKCMDDWKDEKKVSRYLFGRKLAAECGEMSEKHQGKLRRIAHYLGKISDGERAGEKDIDKMAGYFGRIMAEIFAFRTDVWEKSLRRMGFFLGKFIYLMDAYEDIEEDAEQGTYNPLITVYEKPDFEENCERILTMMMAECSKEFEKLPVIDYVDILRNVLYSGVWCRYEAVKRKRKEERENAGPL